MNAVIISIFEILAVGFVVYGLFHEDKFVRFEERLVAAVKRKSLRVIDGTKNVDKHCA